MSLQDPVSDMICSLRNAQVARKSCVTFPYSRHKEDILNLLVREGFIESAKKVTSESQHPALTVQLKYFKGQPVISEMRRVSKPSLRKYVRAGELPSFYDGLGVVVLSTSKGLMTEKEAKKLSIGGEVLLQVV